MVCDILKLIDSTRKNAINLNKKNIYNHTEVEILSQMRFSNIFPRNIQGLDISMDAAPARQTAIDTARMALAPRLDWPDLFGVC